MIFKQGLVRTYVIISLLWIALLFLNYWFKWKLIIEKENQDFFNFYLISTFWLWISIQFGITIFTSLVSSFTQRKVKEKIALTGELTLRGKVLPVGGIKEKILAAKRSGINEIVLSKQNKKDILEINKNYIIGMKFHYVDNLKQVIDITLHSEKVENPVIIS